MQSIHGFAARKIYRHIDLNKVYEMIKNNVKTTNVISIDVRKSTGYILAEDVYSPFDRPAYDISHVDGYAIRYEDLSEASGEHVKFKIVKGINSRKAHKYEIGKGEAVFVETGYPLPRGADTVIPIEDTVLMEDYVMIPKKYRRGEHVFRKATDYKKGELIIKKGTRITPFMIKALLDLGIGEIKVYRKPCIIVYSVGDELVDEPFSNEEWKLPMSTKYLDRHVIEHYGGQVIDEIKLPDDPRTIASSIREELERADLLITIGGVSMGPKDHTWITLYEEFKPKYYWRGTKIHPARSLSGLIIGEKLVINQPGLHQSSFSALFFVIVPVINYLQGLTLEPNYPYTIARIKNDYINKKYINHYRLRPAKVSGEEAQIINAKGSYYLKPILESNGFIVLKPGIDHLKTGEPTRIYYFPPINHPQTYNVLW
ncbi:MAG: molybdopterin molybdotransferase MoeA [Staphylothermus sp.]|nr:molybdopterin molybdotransferase MoeA [Staphylothermus sp.]